MLLGLVALLLLQQQVILLRTAILVVTLGLMARPLLRRPLVQKAAPVELVLRQAQLFPVELVARLHPELGQQNILAAAAEARL
jgi:hypothetical protein